ncbi:MAG: hypothetical protein IH868_08695 [Chloroflexi bacterium]|nr:hypothetical protein [Chloroflexota bacterium]
MRKLLSAIFVTLLTVTTVACSGNADQADEDAIRLAGMADQAVTVASESIENPVLRQIAFGELDGSHRFIFTDPAATVGVEVIAETPALPVAEWQVRDSEFVMHRPEAGLDVSSVRVGPGAVLDAASDQWPGCELRSMTLVGGDEGARWYVFCNLPEGVVSGKVNVVTGELTDSDAPPARVPAIATPVTPTSG